LPRGRRSTRDRRRQSIASSGFITIGSLSLNEVFSRMENAAESLVLLDQAPVALVPRRSTVCSTRLVAYLVFAVVFIRAVRRVTVPWGAGLHAPAGRPGRRSAAGRRWSYRLMHRRLIASLPKRFEYRRSVNEYSLRERYVRGTGVVERGNG